MDALLKPLITGLLEHHPHADVSEVERAFVVARTAHIGQTRKSGEEYITHPVEVTQILIDLGLDQETIIASLLHDTVEDTPYSLDQLRNDFGDQIAALVDGVTKLDKLTNGRGRNCSQDGDCDVSRHPRSCDQACRPVAQRTNLEICFS
jgi:guanosine-3',5'-bis(diphosphate) 3'-pyrophosphohydrolase